MELTREYKLLVSIMGRATSATAAANADNSAATLPHLQALSHEIRDIQQCEDGDRNRSLNWSTLRSGAGGLAAADALLSAHSSFIDAYVALCPVAVARLRQLDAIPVFRRSQMDEFTLVWDIIIGAGMVQWPTGWPEAALIGNLSLYSALDGFMAWFLAFSRGSSQICSCMEQNVGYVDLQVRTSCGVGWGTISGHQGVFAASTLHENLQPPAGCTSGYGQAVESSNLN